jgi:hypothetical protein
MKTSLEKCPNGIHCFQNVSDYKPLERPEFAWQITYEKECFPETTTSPIYFIIESTNQGAFSHWVYESSTWLPHYIRLLEKYPTCTIVFDEVKTFKQLYLEYFGIPNARYCLRSEMLPENYCFFHTYTSLNDTSIPEIYYKNLLHYKATFELVNVPKDISLLYLPRGTKENYIGPNNRVYDIQNDLKEFVKQVGGLVYETDETKHLQDQILLVKRAKIIVLDYGSNLWVNSFFAENSKIICLNIGWHQHPTYPCFGFLWNEIHKTNTVSQIFAYPSETQTENGVPIVRFQLPLILHEIITTIHSLGLSQAPH